MRKASPLSFTGALATLGQRDSVVLSVLERLTSAGILLGAVVFPPALGLLDAKTEAGRLVRNLLDVGVERLRGVRGHDRQQLITAAHTTIVLASLFDALREVIGPAFESLEVTDQEKLQLATAPGEIVSQSGWIEQLATADLPMPSPVLGFEENLRQRLTPRVSELVGGALAFFEGLRAWNRVKLDTSAFAARATGRWQTIYRDVYLRLASEVPEFFVWASLGEHAATRE
jgi:hypothetical protein